MFDREQLLADLALFVGNCLDSGSLDAYYQLCCGTARMRID